MPLRRRTHIARRLRRDATEVEKMLWHALREIPSQQRFRRQHPIGRFVVDFACPGVKLVIELDGGQHATQGDADALRSEELASGYRVLGFWNNKVIENLPGVLEVVQRELEAGTASNPLSALQGGEGGARAEGVGG
jgi:very-short-patch-repair endonuclease